MKEHGIAFPMIDDADGTIRKLYDGGRMTYLIDKDGIISYLLKGVPDNKRLLEELNRQQTPGNPAEKVP